MKAEKYFFLYAKIELYYFYNYIVCCVAVPDLAELTLINFTNGFVVKVFLF